MPLSGSHSFGHMGFRRSICFYFSETVKCEQFTLYSDHDTTIMGHMHLNVWHTGSSLWPDSTVYANMYRCKYVPFYGSVVFQMYIFCKLTVRFLGSVLHVVDILPHLNNKVHIEWYIILAPQTQESVTYSSTGHSWVSLGVPDRFGRL
jgi:hypothetical protein